MKKTVGSTTTYYIGNWFEVTNSSAITKYYYFAGKRVAMRTSAGVTYLHGDHLGSTSVTSGANVSAQTYYAYGVVRTTSGTLPTDYTFTGQKADASDGLMYYGARYYDAALGRFTQPDSFIPNLYNPQTLNRYAYVYNNPLRYTDPTGHCPGCAVAAFFVSPPGLLLLGGLAVATYANYQINLAPNAAENRQAISNAINSIGENLNNARPQIDPRVAELQIRANSVPDLLDGPLPPPKGPWRGAYIAAAIIYTFTHVSIAVQKAKELDDYFYESLEESPKPLSPQEPYDPCGGPKSCIGSDPHHEEISSGIVPPETGSTQKDLISPPEFDSNQWWPDWY